MTTGLMMLVAFVLLVGLAGTALLIQDGMAAQRRVAARLALVSARSRSAAPATAIRRRGEGAGRLAGVAAVLGCDWKRRESYPVRWWIVLSGTCVAGRVAAMLASGLLDEAS